MCLVVNCAYFIPHSNDKFVQEKQESRVWIQKHCSAQTHLDFQTKNICSRAAVTFPHFFHKKNNWIYLFSKLIVKMNKSSMFSLSPILMFLTFQGVSSPENGITSSHDRLWERCTSKSIDPPVTESFCLINGQKTQKCSGLS